jgi:hypothetical protein
MQRRRFVETLVGGIGLTRVLSAAGILGLGWARGAGAQTTGEVRYQWESGHEARHYRVSCDGGVECQDADAKALELVAGLRDTWVFSSDGTVKVVRSDNPTIAKNGLRQGRYWANIQPAGEAGLAFEGQSLEVGENIRMTAALNLAPGAPVITIQFWLIGYNAQDGRDWVTRYRGKLKKL